MHCKNRVRLKPWDSVTRTTIRCIVHLYTYIHDDLHEAPQTDTVWLADSEAQKKPLKKKITLALVFSFRVVLTIATIETHEYCAIAGLISRDSVCA